MFCRIVDELPVQNSEDNEIQWETSIAGSYMIQ